MTSAGIAPKGVKEISHARAAPEKVGRPRLPHRPCDTPSPAGHRRIHNSTVEPGGFHFLPCFAFSSAVRTSSSVQSRLQ